MEINMRSTTIRTLKNVAVIVPNSEFVSAKLENWSYGDETVRLDIDVGVSYESDLEIVIRCLKEVAAEHPEVLRKPAPDVLHLGFGESAWNMRLRVWLAHPRCHPEVHSDINCAIVRKFRENGVEIPFPQRDLHVARHFRYRFRLRRSCRAPPNAAPGQAQEDNFASAPRDINTIIGKNRFIPRSCPKNIGSLTTHNILTREACLWMRDYFQLGSSVHRPSLATAAFAGPRSTTCSAFGFSVSFSMPISTILLMVVFTISVGIPSLTGQTFAVASAS